MSQLRACQQYWKWVNPRHLTLLSQWLVKAKGCNCPSAGACGIDHSWTTISCLLVRYQYRSLLPVKNWWALLIEQRAQIQAVFPWGLAGPHRVIVYIPCGQLILSLSRVLKFHCWHCTSDSLGSTSDTSAVMLKYVAQFKKCVYMNLSNWFNCTLSKLTKFDPVASDPYIRLRDIVALHIIAVLLTLQTGAFLAKIRALDRQNSNYVLKKRVNSTRDVLTTKVRNSTRF